MVSLPQSEEVEQTGPQALARKHFVPGGVQVPDRIDTLLHRAVPVVEDDSELQQHCRQMVVIDLLKDPQAIFNARDYLPRDEDDQGQKQLNVREVMLDEED